MFQNVQITCVKISSTLSRTYLADGNQGCLVCCFQNVVGKLFSRTSRTVRVSTLAVLPYIHQRPRNRWPNGSIFTGNPACKRRRINSVDVGLFMGFSLSFSLRKCIFANLCACAARESTERSASLGYRVFKFNFAPIWHCFTFAKK
jgi:hypothetical protein